MGGTGDGWDVDVEDMEVVIQMRPGLEMVVILTGGYCK